MTDPTPTRAEVERIATQLEQEEGCGLPQLAADMLRALRERVEAAERRAYDLAVAIMGGEDAPGYADSIPTQVLVDQQQEMAQEWLHRVTPDAARRAEAAAWNDAIEAAANVSGHYMSDDADEALLDMWREDIRALRRAAPTEGEA